MKKISYEDDKGRTITKKEGFSWPIFFVTIFLPIPIISCIIYVMSKGGFMAIRGAIRGSIKATKKIKSNSKK